MNLTPQLLLLVIALILIVLELIGQPQSKGGWAVLFTIAYLLISVFN